MKSNLEIELKLQVTSPDVWQELLDSPLWGDKMWRQQMMEAIYFDTPSRALNERRIAYRVRREGSQYVATVKSGGSSKGGLHQRREWNVEVKDSQSDITVFKELDCWPELEKIAGDQPFAPLFITAFERRTLDIYTNEGAVIEVAADKGEIIAGEKRAPILELELELKRGEPKSLLKLGARATKEYPLLLEARSKFHRAMELAGLISVQPELKAAGAKEKALENIQSLLALQVTLQENGQDIRRTNALLLELWAEML